MKPDARNLVIQLLNRCVNAARNGKPCFTHDLWKTYSAWGEAYYVFMLQNAGIIDFAAEYVKEIRESLIAQGKI